MNRSRAPSSVAIPRLWPLLALANSVKLLRPLAFGEFGGTACPVHAVGDAPWRLGQDAVFLGSTFIWYPEPSDSVNPCDSELTFGVKPNSLPLNVWPLVSLNDGI